MMNESDAIADYANNKIYDVDLQPISQKYTTKEEATNEDEFINIINLLQVALKTSLYLLEGDDTPTEFELAGLREAQEISKRFIDDMNS